MSQSGLVPLLPEIISTGARSAILYLSIRGDSKFFSRNLAMRNLRCCLISLREIRNAIVRVFLEIDCKMVAWGML
jgi:hypothetical protein